MEGKGMGKMHMKRFAKGMKGEIYDLLRTVIMIVIALVFLFAVSMYFIRGEASPLSGVSNQLNSTFCNADADCKEGVCVGGSCTCFLDSQCKVSNRCDMGTGLCGK